jgi:hypothetical protein
MASDLVLRLCQVDEDDGGLPGAGLSPGEPGYDPQTTHIALNDFTDGLFDLMGGYHTDVQMKTFYNMPANQQAQLDVLVGKINSAPNLTKLLGRVHRFRSILTKWERRSDLNLTGYDSPDDIETQLMALDQGFL